ncbi:MAG TPA: cell division protein FtsA [Nevskiaceae bacterium]|nr:cell division protein FtsA [Nevskiaceae bacterium]
MSKRASTEYVVGIDVGTTKVSALIGERQADNSLRLVGFGQGPSAGGLKKGVVVNIESTVAAIGRAVEAAELMANCRVRSAQVTITGSHVASRNSVGVVPIRHREVMPRDVDAVIEAASAVAISADQQILHVLAQEFVVDGQEGIQDPVGMNAVRLEAKVHIITGAVSPIQNLYKCVERCGLSVEKLVLAQVASAEAVLLHDERELGVCVVDIGGGTSDIAVFKADAIRHTAVLPIGGDLVTSDISVALRTPAHHAEAIKKQYGCARPEAVVGDAPIDVPTVGDSPARSFSRQTLADVIRPRLAELLRYVRKELHRADAYDLIAGGVVLTGGVAQTPGLVELAQDIFEMPVRVGVPQGLQGAEEVLRDPGNAAGAGLLLYALGQQPRRGRTTGAVDGMQGWAERTRSWIAGHL